MKTVKMVKKCENFGKTVKKVKEKTAKTVKNNFKTDTQTEKNSRLID